MTLEIFPLGYRMGLVAGAVPLRVRLGARFEDIAEVVTAEVWLLLHDATVGPRGLSRSRVDLRAAYREQLQARGASTPSIPGVDLPDADIDAAVDALIARGLALEIDPESPEALSRSQKLRVFPLLSYASYDASRGVTALQLAGREVAQLRQRDGVLWGVANASASLWEAAQVFVDNPGLDGSAARDWRRPEGQIPELYIGCRWLLRMRAAYLQPVHG